MESESFSSRSEASTECKPLLDVATKDLFRRNAFRITGLPVDATVRDVGKHAEKLKVLAELGQDPQPNAAFPLQPSPTVEDIRDAIQTLKDPEKRLIDEFFWFWPENFGESRSDAAIQSLEKGDLEAAAEIWMSKRKHPTEGVVATHNLALIFHISALEWENHSLKNDIDAKRRAEVTEYWNAAFYRWDRVATSEQLWEKVVTRIRQLNEPSLTTGFARRMRTSLPIAFCKINAELALAFARSNKLEPARLQVQLMRNRSNGLADADRAAELVLVPARKRIDEQVRQARQRAEKNAHDGISAARDLLQQSRDGLALFDVFFGKESELRSEVFDEVASTCNQLQVIYHKASGDNKTSIELLKTILPIAISTELRQQIEKNISTATENLAYLQFQLRIRDDEIEITPDKVRYNTQVLPSADITGIRFGVFVQYVNGIRTSVSYGIAIGSGSHGVVRIECKRFFRSEKQAEQDFHAIVAALFNHIVPPLCNRLAKVIVGGTPMPLGDRAQPCYLTSDGIRTTTGMLRWKKDHLTPWSDVRFSVQSGQLRINSATNRGLFKSFSLRDVWNAVIFEQLAKEIVRLRAPLKPDRSTPPPLPEENNPPRQRVTAKGYLALGIFGGLGVLFAIGLFSGPRPSSTYKSPSSNSSTYSYSPGVQGGSGYRIPSSTTTLLAAEKTEIESERPKVQAFASEVEDLARQIERDRMYLDRTDQLAVDAANAKIRRYNMLLQEQQSAEAAFNQRVDDYNAKVRAYSR